MLIKTIYLRCLALLCAMGAAAYAQSVVTIKVQASEGEVEIRRDSTGRLRTQTVAFKVNDDLFAGDTIITGKNGRLVLALSDGSQAVVAPKTTLVIQDLRQSPRTLFQMLKGKTRVQIEKLGGQPNPYRINTPTAVIAVRGTIFDVLVEEDETEVFLHEGAVDVFNAAQLNQPVFLNAGQTTRIRAQRLPNAPVPFKVGRNDDMFRMREMRGNGNGAPGARSAGNNNPNGSRRGENDNGRVAQGGQRPPDVNDKPRQPDNARNGGGNAPPPRPAGGGRRP